MDLQNMPMEEKCENLMTIVVESRKQFGKMCEVYRQNSTLIENKMLNLRLETIANYKLKSKNKLPDIDLEDVCKNADDFAAEIEERQKRIQELFRSVKNAQEVVMQLEHDNVGRRAHMKLTADNLLRIAKERNM